MNLATQSEAPDSDVFSFKLVGTLKSDCLEIGWIDKNNALSAGVSGALLIALEKRKERFIREYSEEDFTQGALMYEPVPLKG